MVLCPLRLLGQSNCEKIEKDDPRIHFDTKGAWVISLRKSNYNNGFIFVKKVNPATDHLGIEIYTAEGNLIIPVSRGYADAQYNEKDWKYILVQADDSKCSVGICDLNGYEIEPPIYFSVDYDGYDFYATTHSGRNIKKNIHRRPTKDESTKIATWNGYYATMPWLMMPGPSYTPYIDIKASINEWNSIPIFGGVGDYVPSYSSDPCVNAAIGVANSTNSLIQQGINVNNTPSNQTSSRMCPYCNGTGKKVYETYSVSSFGLSDTKVYCNECGGDFPKSRAHSHITCGQCGGTGIAR